MRTLAALFSAGLLLAGAGAARAQDADLERPLVIDQASALAEDTQAELTRDLQRIRADTGVEARLVIVRDLRGKTASAVARTFMAPGEQEQAVLLLAMRDRQVRVQTTQGLQSRISDQVWVAMIASEILPELRRVRQSSASRQGVEGLGEVLANQYEPRPLTTAGDFAALRDVGVVALVALLLALGLYPRSRARILSKAHPR